MKHIRIFALLLSILVMLSSLGGLSLADGGEGSSGQQVNGGGGDPSPASEVTTPAPEVTTPAPEVTTPAPEVTTPAPEVTTPAPEVTTPAPEVTTPAPEVTTPAPEVTTPAPDVTTPAPEVTTPAPEVTTPAPEVTTPAPEVTTPAPEVTTPAPQSTSSSVQYPRIVFNPDGVVMDYSRARQGGYITVALPIGYEVSAGQVYWSNTPAGGSWRPGVDPHPGYFSQEITQYLNSARWEVDGSGFDLNTVFDMSGGDDRNVFARAPEDNDWNMAEGTVFNAGYAVFTLPIYEHAPNGTYRIVFEFDMPGHVSNSNEKLEYAFQIILQNAVATPSPTTAPTEPDYDDPDNNEPDYDDPGDIIYPGSGVVMIGECEVQTVKVKQTGVKLSIPISYVIENARIYSNHSTEGKVVKPGQGSSAYSQSILNYIKWLEVSVSPETAASDAFPFQLSEQGVGKTVIANGANYGYAVFDDLTVKRNLSNGSMAVPLTVRWIESGSDEILTTEISTLVNITGASTGGGGGGGSYVAPTTPPQARVLVDSLRTDPENVKAGDSFDLVMTLKNTSAGQYVQNMRLTVTSEEDTLIPLSGSNTLYIDRIDKDSTYELRYPVRANMQVPDHPVKVDVSIEYEDSKVAAQSASQSLVVDVEQNRRVKVDEPVLDNTAPMAGDSITASLQVINEGRTILYNVTVIAQCDNENIILPVSSYLGNIEGGTSKKAELDLIPTMAGDYNVTLQISYEDAMGEQFSETKSLSFYTMEEESYDSYYPMDDYYSDDMYVDDSGDDITAETIMQMLPFWIYALGGGILVATVMLMGLSARNRHRKALEDDEMD